MINVNFPEGWKITSLGEVAEFINGRAFKPSEWTNKGLPIIRIQNLTGSSSKINYYDGDYEQEYYVKYGDILLSWSATLDIFKWKKGPALLNQHIFKVKPKNDVIFDDYFLFYLKTMVQKLKDKTHGSGMKHITKPELLKQEFILPPIHVQRHIIPVLERAEQIKQMRIEADGLAGKLLQTVFLEMFINSKRTYTEKTLNDVCLKITDGTHITPDYVDSGVPFLRVTDLTESNASKRYISEEEHKELIKRCKPEKGDVLYSKNGTIGVAKAITWDYEFSIFVSLCLLKPNKDIIRSKFLEYFLNTNFALRQAVKHSKTGTITNLHLVEIKQIKIPLPTLEEQDKFVEIVEKVEGMRKNQKESKQETENLFNALMQKAFKGELVI
ncbi:Type-1 restriction enzyme MjaXIP specificity protein [uncultured archaeon]|nr:Type-1 restriction enzyme MjaXIP specificity protein [uncultured archaeon]